MKRFIISYTYTTWKDFNQILTQVTVQVDCKENEVFDLAVFKKQQVESKALPQNQDIFITLFIQVN